MPWYLVLEWIKANWREIALFLGVISVFGWGVSCKRVLMLKSELKACQEAKAALSMSQSVTATAAVKAETKVKIVYLPSPDGKPSPCPDVEVSNALMDAAIVSMAQAVTATPNASISRQNGLGPWEIHLGAAGATRTATMPYIGAGYHFPVFGVDCGVEARMAYPFEWWDAQRDREPIYSAGLTIRP